MVPGMMAAGCTSLVLHGNLFLWDYLGILNQSKITQKTAKSGRNSQIIL